MPIVFFFIISGVNLFPSPSLSFLPLLLLVYILFSFLYCFVLSYRVPSSLFQFLFLHIFEKWKRFQ